ncbi:MAG: SIR2 family NAD-dependent protein deacylase [Thermodesulfobacteriota bacterium]
MQHNALAAVVEWIKDSSEIVFLTGPELCMEAGIPDVTDRSFNPNINQFKNRVEVREEYWEKIKKYYPKISSAKPSPTHEAIYEIELIYNVNCILTQCGDGLHLKTGSEKVIEIYASINWVTCPGCGKDYKMEEIMLELEKGVKTPICKECGNNRIKPPISFPDQALPHWEIRESWIRLQNCDLLIIVGANLDTEPVASFPFQVMNNENKVVIIGEAGTPCDDYVSAVINGKPSQVLPYVLKQLKKTTIVS